MEVLAGWEKVLLGVLALLLILWFRPGLKRALEQSRKAERDWPGVLIPLGLVALLVLLLIVWARHT